MAKVRPRLLVIDADVAVAAGDREVEPSRICTAFLEAVREHGHHVAMSSHLLDEWKRHQSRFARIWLLSMYARRRVEKVEAPADRTFRSRLEAAAPTQRVAEIMLKDAHLIELACGAGGHIISLDEEARNAFRAAARAVAELRGLCWVNPSKPDGI
jgi:hypothetical protein